MAIFRDDAFKFLTGQMSDRAVPPGISGPEQGGKFSPEGVVQHWPGNTFICHVPKDSAQHAALCAMQGAMMASEIGDFFSWLPPASFHMTVFQGISPDDPVWPDGLSRDVSRDEVTAVLLGRLHSVSLPQHFTPSARGLYAGHSVTLEGIDAVAEARLRGARMALRDATGLKPHGFETYTFHITLGYPLRWLTAVEAKAVIAASDATFAAHGAALAEVPLGPVEFCCFENMHHFEIIAKLG
jgi:hypothetical protein